MTLAVAFLGGLVSCLSPCVMPVIPVFISAVAGGPGGGAIGLAAGARHRAAGFLLGFAGIFVALWVSLGLIGFALFDAVPVARQVAGIAIVVLGIATIGGWQSLVVLGR